jgi:hypothetical protein
MVPPIVPVTFRVPAAEGCGEPEKLLEKAYSDPDKWAQRSVDVFRDLGVDIDSRSARELHGESRAAPEVPAVYDVWSDPLALPASTISIPI